MLSKVACAVVFGMAASSAYAVDFQWGDNWEGRFDSTFSAGASWRVEGQDPDLIGKANNNGTGVIPGSGVVPRGAWSNNGDDGDLNFKRGETFSKIAKGSHEFSLKYKDSFGVYASGLYFYDFELMDEHRDFRELDQDVLDQQGADAKFLSAFTYFNFDLFERPTKFSVGKQVINWGENTFIAHGISEGNQPLDVTKLRTPGAEVKEAFLPLGSALFSMGVTDTIDVEAYYQYQWDSFQSDGSGTYFSTTDYAGPFTPSTVFGTPGGRYVHLLFAQPVEGAPGTVAYRTADRDADDGGQYGIKASWYAEELNETEFGFYYINYHNRRPVISAYAHDGVVGTKGFFEYPEDIQLYGLSFNTTIQATGTSVGGEISYRKDEPLQIDDVELLFATLEPIGAIPSGTSQIPGGTLPGHEISGYRLFDTIQAQSTFTQLLGPTFGADEFTLLAELGMNYIQDMPDQDELRLEASGTHRSGNSMRAGNGYAFLAGPGQCRQFLRNPNGTTVLGPNNLPLAFQCEGTETNQFATQFSWGYRVLAKLDYNSLFWGINVSPRMIFQHDVNGSTPTPISNFIEDRKALGVGASFDYQNRWNMDVSYNRFFGGQTGADGLSDRDFVSLTVKYSI
ncbi:MAG: DUF1302 domain-containing protein [Gammaproteobacteria bacterium]|nr:DUF1302 domain-containing protein [Gammaproteobacteria bacterium]